MLTTAGRDSILAKIDSDITHIGLLTAITDWRAGTVTEATYTDYARQAITFGSAGATSPAGGRQIANSGDIDFPKNTGSNQDMIGYGLYSASTSGTLVDIGLFDTDPPIVGTVDASTDLITAYAHGLVADQRVFLLAAPIGTVPNVFAENTAYYVLATGLTADKFALSATSGGAAINATASGIAMFCPYKVQSIPTNSVLTISDGQLIIQV